jgi:molybdopterin molybdotransferase
MLSIREALELMVPEFSVLPAEDVPLLAASGRVLAEDVSVRIAQPEFDHSAMDGYALRAADVSAGRPLPVSGEVRAGGTPQPLTAGTAVRIFTGAPLPPGADLVIMQENAERTADRVSFSAVPAAGTHVRKCGSDHAVGSRLFTAGTALGPSEIGLLASQGIALARVHRRPRVAILPTGDELRAIDAPHRPFSIVDSNTYALAAAVQQAGATAWPLPITSDDPAQIAERVGQGLGADVLLTVGGVSVGEYDFVAESLRAAGVSVRFHKVAMKPGKPLRFGKRGETPVIGLPGNPVSALVVFELFVRPGLLRMQGLRDPHPQPIEVVLATPYPHRPGRSEFVRARLRREAGAWVAEPHAKQGSASLASLTAESALVIVPAAHGDVPAGETLQAIWTGLPRRPDPGFAD